MNGIPDIETTFSEDVED